MHIKSITQFIFQNKKNRWASRLFFASIVLFGIFIASFVFGQGVLAGATNFLIKGVTWIMLEFAQLCISFTIFFLRYFITLASYNSYIDVSIVKLGWAMVRDVANMFFVVILLVIAFTTILGLEQYEWKKGLAKLVTMAVFINFSNLIAQVIIDVAHVFTITFLNAFSATAGGNLINMFNLDKITSMVHGKSLGTTPEGVDVALFGAAVVAMLFALFSAVALGSYLIVMAFRVVILWALIILSPLAYLLYALPKGEKYAQEWWSEFMKHVIVAPVMVFFLWLAFATLGTGNIAEEIQSKSETIPLKVTDEVQSISLSKASTWENMANYLIAFVFLMIGLKKTQESGVQGAGMVSSATNLGKKVATIAAGIKAAKFMGSGAVKHAPLVGTNVLKDYAKAGKDLIPTWLNRLAAGETRKSIKEKQKIVDLEMDAQVKEGQANNIRTEIEKLNKEKGSEGDEEKQKEIQEQITKKQKELNEIVGETESIRETVQQKRSEVEGIEPGLIGKTAGFLRGATLKRRKMVGKSENTNKLYEELAMLRTTSRASLLAHLAETVTYGEKGRKIADAFDTGLPDEDKLLKGMIAGDRVRKDGKMAEYTEIGKYMSLNFPRIQGRKYSTSGNSLFNQAEIHKLRTEILDSNLKSRSTEERIKLLADESLNGFANRLATSKVMAAELQDRLTGTEETLMYKKHQESIAASKKEIETAVKNGMGQGDDNLEKKKDEAYQANKDAEDEYKKLENEFEKLPEGLAKVLKDMDEAKRKDFLSALRDMTSVDQLDGKDDAEIGDIIKQAQRKAWKEYDLMIVENDMKEYITGKKGKIEKLKEAEGEKNNAEKASREARERYVERKREIIKELDSQGKIGAWGAARAQAQREHEALLYRTQRQEVVDSAAQTHIWDKYGVSTPNNAFAELIETLSKEFKEMNYEGTVSAFKDLYEKTKNKSSEELSLKERAIIFAITHRLRNNSWIDDGITEIDDALKKATMELAQKAGAGYINNSSSGGATEQDVERIFEKVMGGISNTNFQSFGERQRDEFAKVISGLLEDNIDKIISGLKDGRLDKNTLFDSLKRKQVSITQADKTILSDLFKTDDDNHIFGAIVDLLSEMKGKPSIVDELEKRIKKNK